MQLPGNDDMIGSSQVETSNLSDIAKPTHGNGAVSVVRGIGIFAFVHFQGSLLACFIVCEGFRFSSLQVLMAICLSSFFSLPHILMNQVEDRINGISL